MSHTITPEQERLHAYVDGHLDSLARREVEAYLADHPEAQNRVDDYRQINELLGQLYDPLLDEPVPPEMLAPRAPSRRPWRMARMAAAAVTLLCIGLFGGFYLGLDQALTPMSAQTEDEHVVAEAVMAYTVYTPEVRHPVEVSGDQRDHLAGWLSKRMGRPIVVPRLEALDMRLLGGRLLASDDGPGALLMYEDPNGYRIILYACITDGESSAFRYARKQEVSVFYWIDESVNYAIAGELPKESLLPLAESVYNQMMF